MNPIHTVAFSLLTLFVAAATPACMAPSSDAEDAEEGDAQDEEVGTAQAALGPKYQIIGSSTYPVWSAGADIYSYDVIRCSGFTNGVVRSWQLKEKNHSDFRFSRHWCRPMLSDGTLGAENDFADHFYHDGDGTLGMSSVPLDKLPVGVRLQAASSLGYYDHKVSDVAMLHESAADILAKKTGYSQASYALGNNDSTYTVVCPAGQVMIGLGVRDTSGGADRSEIVGVILECRPLVYQ